MQIEDQFELAFLDAFARYLKRRKGVPADYENLLKKKEKLSFLKDIDCDWYNFSLWDDKVTASVQRNDKKYSIFFYDNGEVYTGIFNKDNEYYLKEGIAID